MPNATLLFSEGPPAAPPDDTNLIAVIGVCPGATPGTLSAPVVFAIDDPTAIYPAAAYGAAPELAYKAQARSRKRVLLVPCTAITAAVLGAVTQVGNGPVVTMTAASGAPFDDAAIAVRVKAGGATGAGTFELSYSHSVSRGLPSPLYQSAKTIPARLQATAIGTVDLTGLTYATAATVTGTVDLSGLTYGSGGTLSALTLIGELDGGSTTTCTFTSPATPAQVASAINTAFSASIASVSQQGKLTITSTTIGAASEFEITGGTALTALGLSIADHLGTAGDLDGLTLILAADTGGSHTVTFTPPPANAAAVAAKVATAADVTADVYTTANKLRVQSDTIGSSSTLNITGGTGRTALGLAIPSTPYTGAESTYYIDHLGVTVHFASGTYVAGTTYSASAKAGKPDLTELTTRIDHVYAAGYRPAVFMTSAHYDATTALAIAAGLETKIAALQAQQKYPRARVFVDPAETSANVRLIMDAFSSRWVDVSARGAYIPAGQNPGGGSVTRSQGWLAAILDSAARFSSDLGEHAENRLLDCEGITENEGTATTKLVSTSGLSCNVIDGEPGAYFFAGGYSSALPTSRWVDANVRNVVQRGAVVVQAGLNYYVNRTGLDTNADGTLTEAQAVIVDEDLRGQLEAALVPAHAQAAAVLVSRTEAFFTTKTVTAKMVLKVNPPARIVSGIIGPGNIVSTTVGGGIAEA